YRRGGLGDMKCKKLLNSVMQETLKPIRERRAQYEGDKGYLLEILNKGTATAVELSNKTVAEVRAAIGIDYFTDSTFLDKFVK
ncbi:MAG: tryptophan--tRNA ligase, partial [Ruminococcus sp.]|nr:tryptophan--tRNA ligase [Ruminococcus sp.]